MPCPKNIVHTTHTEIQVHGHTQTHAHMHVHTNTHTHTHTHTHTNTHTHTQTHTHTHAHTHKNSLLVLTCQHTNKHEGREVVMEVQDPPHQVEGNIVQQPSKYKPAPSLNHLIQGIWGEGVMDRRHTAQLKYNVRITHASRACHICMQSLFTPQVLCIPQCCHLWTIYSVTLLFTALGINICIACNNGQ